MESRPVPASGSGGRRVDRDLCCGQAGPGKRDDATTTCPVLHAMGVRTPVVSDLACGRGPSMSSCTSFALAPWHRRIAAWFEADPSRMHPGPRCAHFTHASHGMPFLACSLTWRPAHIPPSHAQRAPRPSPPRYTLRAQLSHATGCPLSRLHENKLHNTYLEYI